MRRFLIIGAAGTVGRNLCKYLQETGKETAVGAFDAVYQDGYYINILEPESIYKAFRRFKPTHVIHLAAAVGRVFNSLDHKNSLMVNVVGTFNVIQECIEHDAKLTYVGTSESYGSRFMSSPQYPADEFAVPRDFPMFKGIYGHTKLMAEKLVEYYTMNNKIVSSVARLFMCYAASGSIANEKTAVHRMFKSALSGEPILAHQRTSRAWCYVDDIVHGIYLVAVKGNRLYNIGNPQEKISAVELAKKIKKLTDSTSDIQVKLPDDDIYPHKDFNINLAANELGFQPIITLDEGLAKIWEALKP